MENLTIGFLGLGAGLILLLLRVQIGVALGLVSFVGIGVLLNARAAWGMLTAVPFNFVGDWNLTAIPMFLLMGFVASETGISAGLFRAMRILLAWLPGGLAVASVGACAMLSAASGSSVATSSAFARIATPEMLRYKYDPGLATGVIAASGTLGSLIPPSILMVLYGYLAEVSIAKLFMAGFLPGLLSATMFIGMIIIRCSFNPRLAPAVSETFTRRDFLDAAREIWALPAIIVGVLVGIFIGLFSPTEAGAIGAALAIALGAARGALSWQSLYRSGLATLTSTAGIFMVVIGTTLLGKFMTLSGVPSFIAESLLSLGSTELIVIAMVAVLYLILGCFLDSIGILLLTMPIILPVAREAGIEPIYFGIILVKLLEIGLVTPPVGLNVYIVKGALGERVSLVSIFRGVSWFIAVDLITLALLISFPIISLYLPSLMG
ncbi:TRAP transporter large permease subunit [Sulfitobacter sp. G21635-S1]|jgi:tripartite ATP-independent transporter DctM subunit|uniref:TRAP transporter large permease n=1 Tax=Sulfitobacter sp. G21635-S1 TaxID=3014043 RepID=UPI0022B05B1D|nr:TRAP transporter large permease subunit [Sulfitobacter sp. G21635-S1]MCZ4258206.1 TRAP transporter large permease subunit [Sulfitobacter sp. G21635-S1]